MNEIHIGLELKNRLRQEIRPNRFDCFIDLEEIVASKEMRVPVLIRFLK